MVKFVVKESEEVVEYNKYWIVGWGEMWIVHIAVDDERCEEEIVSDYIDNNSEIRFSINDCEWGHFASLNYDLND